jgi:hypothetical protein
MPRTEPISGETYAALAAEYSTGINAAELKLVDFLTGIPHDARLSTALVLRRRTTSEAHRYAHAADLAARMPDLFDHFRSDGRFSVDHLDAIWSRINRHNRALRAAGAEVPDLLDSAVARLLTQWIRNTGNTIHTALADVTDEILCTLAPLVAEATETDEAAAVSLTRRGTRLTLDCGSEVTADALWQAIGAAALTTRREMTDDDRPAPPMSRCRGQVALGALGGRRDQLTVTVNAYRPHGDAPAYVLGTGWVCPTTAAELTALATRIRELPDAAEVPPTPSYRFTTLQRALIEGRDGHCRFPGCSVPADRCDHDHLVSSPHTDPDSDGDTCVTNGISLCRTHHTLKTARIWTPTSLDDAVTLHWTGPGGVAVSTVAAGPLSPTRDPATALSSTAPVQYHPTTCPSSSCMTSGKPTSPPPERSGLSTASTSPSTKAPSGDSSAPTVRGKPPRSRS